MALTDEGGGIPATMLVGPTGYNPYPQQGGFGGFGGDGWWVILLLLAFGGGWGGGFGGWGGGGFYSRGRGSNAKRDSMGRYSSERGYSRDGMEMADQLRDLMEDAPDETIRKDIERLLRKVEQM